MRLNFKSGAGRAGPPAPPSGEGCAGTTGFRQQFDRVIADKGHFILYHSSVFKYSQFTKVLSSHENPWHGRPTEQDRNRGGDDGSIIQSCNFFAIRRPPHQLRFASVRAGRAHRLSEGCRTGSECTWQREGREKLRVAEQSRFVLLG